MDRIIRKLVVDSKRDALSALAYADHLEETGGDEREIQVLRRFARWLDKIHMAIDQIPPNTRRVYQLDGMHPYIALKKTAKTTRYYLYNRGNHNPILSGWLTNRMTDDPLYIAKFVRSLAEASIPQKATVQGQSN